MMVKFVCKTYEIVGDALLDKMSTLWTKLAAENEKTRHFVISFRDYQVECRAQQWCETNPRNQPDVNAFSKPDVQLSQQSELY